MDRGRNVMRSFVAACVAILVIGIGAALVLNHYNKSTETAFASPTGVRI
jgi:hypothetical protein